MSKEKKPWYFHLTVFGIVLLGLYTNVKTQTSTTIIGIRLFDVILIGLCKNERDIFVDMTFLVWPNLAGVERQE